MFFRYYLEKIKGYLKPGRVLILYGPRRSGKTFLLDRFLNSFEGKAFYGVGEDRLLREVLESESVERIKTSFSGYDLIAVDEAQRIHKAGNCLKMMVDHLPGVPVIATGSSSFDLARQLGEPLTGRKRTLLLFPLSILELTHQFGPMRPQEWLEELMIFGTYPELLGLGNAKEKIAYMNELRDSYLFKDILEYQNIRHSRKLMDLLTLLAFQIGQEVSLSELATALRMSIEAVSRYLDLLEKAFVIKNIRGFSGNLRKEVTKSSRFYFLDNGVRNAVIGNFNPLSQRGDVGQLFENFIFMERWKKQHYAGIAANNYFWRTYDRQEIDHVEEREGRLYGYEFKFTPKKRVTAPKAWSRAYPDAEFSVITRDNFLNFTA